MFGTNPKRGPVKGDGSVLDVVDSFYTIQGEGPFMGFPAFFIRLAGCNLACKFCDTEFETYSRQSLDILLEKAQNYPGCGLIVITGGEPLRHPIAPLCSAFLALGYQVQIESNGTLIQPLPDGVQIVCSPKNLLGRGYQPIRPDLIPYVCAVKFIISESFLGYQKVPDLGLPQKVAVYIQPMDERCAQKNRQNHARCVTLAKEYGYRLSIQMHKVLGIE